MYSEYSGVPIGRAALVAMSMGARQNWPVRLARAQMERVSPAKPTELLSTKEVIFVEQGQFGQKQFLVDRYETSIYKLAPSGRRPAGPVLTNCISAPKSVENSKRLHNKWFLRLPNL